jgi:hypothetical protein
MNMRQRRRWRYASGEYRPGARHLFRMLTHVRTERQMALARPGWLTDLRALIATLPPRQARVVQRMLLVDMAAVRRATKTKGMR